MGVDRIDRIVSWNKKEHLQNGSSVCIQKLGDSSGTMQEEEFLERPVWYLSFTEAPNNLILLVFSLLSTSLLHKQVGQYFMLCIILQKQKWWCNTSKVSTHSGRSQLSSCAIESSTCSETEVSSQQPTANKELKSDNNHVREGSRSSSPGEVFSWLRPWLTHYSNLMISSQTTLLHCAWIPHAKTVW